jgi:glycosyltransferase involved in cell wall biosynthesis
MSPRAARRLTIFIAHPSELLTDHLPHGDGLVAFGFIRRLAERGHELHVAAQGVDLRAEVPANLHIYELMPGSRVSIAERLTFMVRMRMLFRRLSRRISFDLVHQMNPVFTGLSLSLVGVRTPLVLGTFVPLWDSTADTLTPDRSPMTRVKHAVLRVIARLQQAQAAGLLIASPEAISRIARPERHEDRIYQVPHGIDLTRFAARTTVPARPSVLFLTSVIYRKGIFTLLEAFEQVARAMPEAELVIAGGGHQLDEVRARVARMSGCSIRITGHVDRSEVPAVMREHSVYCLPSYGEPFATSVLEAMACGVPIVATSAGGIPHLVTQDGGRLVEARDATALASALVEVLSSPSLQASMGRHNRARVEAEFEIERAVDRLEDAYEAIARTSARRPALPGPSGRVRVEVVGHQLSSSADREAGR